MIPYLTLGLIIFIFLIFEAFFSGSEIALVAANRKKLSSLTQSNSRMAHLAQKIVEEPSWFLSTTLVGSNLMEVANTALVTSILISFYGNKGDFYTFLLLTPLILVFGEIFPKSLFQEKADKWILKIAPIIWFFSIILFPLVWLMSTVTTLALGILRLKKGQSPFLTREELQLILQAEGEHSDMKPLEKDMIHRIFRFSQTKVKEVMIPLVDVVALEEKATISEALDLTRKENYSRYPVFRERVDNIIGLLHSFDLLLQPQKEGTIQPLIRPISFFPETKPIDEIFREMQRNQESMAAVVDEYGGAVGIVTIEDILEEVVGEIEDEYDAAQLLYRKVGPKKFIIIARMEIDHLNEALKINLPKGDYETLGGFILERLGRIPAVGESFRYQDILFEVLKADERSISEVLITLK